MEISEQGKFATTLFADLILPVPIPTLFTYRVPQAMNELVAVGHRAIVQFGDRKILTGVIGSIHTSPPKEYEAKYILELLDEFPILTPVQLRFLGWMAEYYVCSQGEVLNAALPSGLKLSSESKAQLNPAFNIEESDHLLSEKELILLRRLQNETLDYSQISKLLGVKHVYHLLKSLVTKEAIILFEEVKEKFKPRREKRVRLHTDYTSHETLEKLFELLASKPKQEAILLRYLQLVPMLQDITRNRDGISKKDLLAFDELSESSLSTLVKNKILEEFEVIVSRFDFSDDGTSASITLSADQQQAQTEILTSFNQQQTVLLQGITGSGKTEIYISLIKQAIDSGSQVLYLLPEIALTTQIVQRLKRVFGNSVGIYHSKFSDNERVEVWNGVLNGTIKFVVGVRSAIFLPFDNLGLIIVDEEHEQTYKQQEPAPRYHARDASIILARLHSGKTLLGSATPSVESYYNAKAGRYGFVSLTKRFGEASLPSIHIADLGQERKQKTIKGEFSSLLLRSIQETLARNEQVIIFQNRRGYSPVLTCEDCGWVPECVNCAVSLTYHQYKHALVCHYCGYREPLPAKCSSCSSTRLKSVGYGTEKLEEELNMHFPGVSIQRMDLDTTRSKTGYETIIDEFERGDTKILVGTQMVTKGLDFGKVSLVGIFNADRMIHFPDFRSYERAYQLITQVSGRAGRREKAGRVIIQTSSPTHPVLIDILKNTPERFYEKELLDRQQHGYPPFTRIIEITVKHQDKKASIGSAGTLSNMLRAELPGVRILGPAEPPIGKIRNQFLMNILIKIPRGKADLGLIKSRITEQIHHLQKEKDHRNSRFIIDVDPV